MTNFYKLVIGILFCVFFNCTSDEGSINQNNQQQQLESSQIVFNELVNDNLLQDPNYTDFINNYTSSYSLMDISKNSFYDSNENKTIVNIRIAPFQNLNNVSVVSFIPKSMASNVNEIEFDIQPDYIVNIDPVVMWHLDCVSENYVIDFTMIFSGNHITSGTTTDELFVLTDNDIENSNEIGPFNYQITRLLSEHDFEDLIDLGMPINSGCNPPDLNTSVLLSPAYITGSNTGQPSDAVGTYRDDNRIKFYNQLAGNIRLQTKIDDGSEIHFLDALASGSENNFSVFIEIILNNGSSNARMLIVYSGSIHPNGLVTGLYCGVLMLDNYGNPGWIENGTGVVYKDGDGISEVIDF